MEEHGLPLHFREVIGAIYKGAMGRVRGAFGEVSEPFPINRGVLQGDILSPVLFIMCLNSIWMRSELPPDGWQITEDWLLSEISYADDIVLIETTTSTTQERLQRLGDISLSTASMSISIPKTMHMTVVKAKKTSPTTLVEATEISKFHCDICNRGFPTIRGVSSHKRFCRGSVEEELANPRGRKYQKADKIIKFNKRSALVEADPKVVYNGLPLNNVHQFRYLGSQTEASGGCELELEYRIGYASGAFKAHSGIWKNMIFCLDFKIRLFKVCILSILLYGCESWKMTRKMVRNLRGFTARCFARITNVRVAAMEDVVHYVDVILMVERRRWKWLGHAIRMSKSRNPYRCLDLLDYQPGSLLAHLPLNLRNIDNRFLVASNRTDWMERTFLDRITLKTLLMQYPVGAN